jgi:hypothetical protein
MSFESFNSVGGYSVGIPPTPVINENGIATLTGLQVAGISNLGSINNLILLGGESGYFLQTDGLGTLTWAPASGSGNGVPGGINSAVQFNNNGGFGGDIGFTYNSVTNQLSVPGNVVATNYVASGNIVGTNVSVTGNISGTKLNITTITATGDISGGNATLGNAVTANYFIGNLDGIANLAVYAATANSVAGGNVAGQVGNALIASTVYTNAQPNITSVGTLTSLTVNGGTALGSISNVKITGGTNGYYLQTDGTGNLSWVAGTGSGNGTPGGSNTQIQFNNSGSFGATANLTFDTSTNTVNLVGNLIANTLQIGSGAYEFCKSSVYFATTASTSPDQVLWSTLVGNLTAVDFTIISTDPIGGARQTTRISSTFYNGVVAFNEYAGLQINGGVGSFSVAYNSGLTAIQLLVTPDTSHQTSYKMLIIEYSD